MNLGIIFATCAVVSLTFCKKDNLDVIKDVKSLQLDEDEEEKSEQAYRLNIQQVEHIEPNGFLQKSTRITIVSYGEIMHSYQEIYSIFSSLEKVNIGEESLYLITCDRQDSSWGARSSIIVWGGDALWRITPLHFNRASLYKHPKRFIVEERMGNKDEAKSPSQLFEFNNGLIYKYKP